MSTRLNKIYLAAMNRWNSKKIEVSSLWNDFYGDISSDAARARCMMIVATQIPLLTFLSMGLRPIIVLSLVI